jgi:Xaa-Pro aminopeptidase
MPGVPAYAIPFPVIIMLTLPSSPHLRSDSKSFRDPGAPAFPPAPDFQRRRGRTLEVARRAHGAVDAVILCDPHDIQYLTGTREGISWLVLLESAAFAVSRHMLVSEVRAEAHDCEILLAASRSTERPDLAHFVIGKLAQRGLARVVVDPARLSAQSYFQLAAQAASAGLEVCCLPDLLAGLRAVKDAAEIALTRRCVAIAETAFKALLEQGAGALIGRTERDLADELEARLWTAGADRQGFPGTGIIVASGPNSASAHHSPGTRRVAAGESLLIDWGAELAGYRSDTTRTVFLGSVPEFARQAYPIVEQALHRAARRLRAGATMGEIDQAARETVTDADYPEFHYGVGHGVGLAIHEAPWLRADATELCEPDMLTTIEPGIYLPGIGGIRIENLYRVTPDGNECLGGLPTELGAMMIS